MPKPKGDRAAWDILALLLSDNLATEELAKALEIPNATVRAELSFLNKQGLVERVPEQRRGIPFRLTAAGKNRLDQIIKEKQGKK